MRPKPAHKDLTCRETTADPSPAWDGMDEEGTETGARAF